MRAIKGSSRTKTSCCSLLGRFFSFSTKQAAKQASGAMADRHFVNDMPDFVEEREDGEQEEAKTGEGGSLKRLLFLPYDKASLKFLQAGVEIKDKVVKETWLRAGGRVKNFTLYTGSLGTAYLLLKAYRVTKDVNDLSQCAEIIEACTSASRRMREDVTFICGQAGVYALGAAAAKLKGDQALVDDYLTLFKEDPIVKDVIKEGRRLSQQGGSPLMYAWHGKKYWGAAHGLAGIMHVLMDMQLNPEEQESVKGTLRYMIQNRFPSGNYPSSEGSSTDRLVHWCHGAPGVALTLCKAAKVFRDEQFAEAAVDAGEVVWRRGLLRRLGICHGVSGNAYVFLSLYRLTGKQEYLYKAKAFAAFLLDGASRLISSGEMHGGDNPYSLFEGMGGMAHLFLDMGRPSDARFPAYEL
ncbi:lanC-like protein GCR2 isoform X2 [Nymphaea colorata]|uniref:lanC-like protein GCR2 isoform X2 n=1 Tax=Nymphaea colorata TaxID=210225 RepID=UPI00129DD597|nr:lanC-like protein GCR2 isoform X2 [Nymphaea colorata]